MAVCAAPTRGELWREGERWENALQALQPLTRQMDGLADVEERYRQRHLDLIVSPRTPGDPSAAAPEPRQLHPPLGSMSRQNFLEIEPPCSMPRPAAPTPARSPTHHNTLDCRCFPAIATELHLKRLVVGGFRAGLRTRPHLCRNEGISTRHNPEFTSVEVYQAYATTPTMMALTEALIAEAAQQVWRQHAGSRYQGRRFRPDAHLLAPGHHA